jgi:ABC-type transport system involved in multi-copper enzyme maturation permease subunit
VRALVANIEDVMREAAARWTLIAYFLLSSLFIIIFASAINLDIVDGTLAGAKLFGQDTHVSRHGSPLDIEQLVVGFESGFSTVLYGLCTFLAIFATAHLVPRLQEKGTIDLYLSRPTSRVRLLLSRYLAGLVLATTNIVYLFGTIWLIVVWKTHVVHPQFFVAAAINLLTVATMLSFAFVVGVVTSSTGVSIMSTYALFFFAPLLWGLKRASAAFSKDWQVWLTDTLYWIVPKSWELGQAVFINVAAGQIPRAERFMVPASAYLSTAAFALACLTLASWVFHRKEF